MQLMLSCDAFEWSLFITGLRTLLIDIVFCTRWIFFLKIFYFLHLYIIHNLSLVSNNSMASATLFLKNRIFFCPCPLNLEITNCFSFLCTFHTDTISTRDTVGSARLRTLQCRYLYIRWVSSARSCQYWDPLPQVLGVWRHHYNLSYQFRITLKLL